MRLGFVGAGKVGWALAHIWRANVTVVASRTHARAVALAHAVGAVPTKTPVEAVQHSDVLFLTVPDDAIETVAQQLASVDLTGKMIVHTSGAHDRHVLAAAARGGAITGSLHPALPFADSMTALQNLPGTTFAVEAEDPTLRTSLLRLVQQVPGREIIVPTQQKALYHAALVIASNYTVTLYHIASQLLGSMSDDGEAINSALNALMDATIQNLRDYGTPAALTGPLVRADVGTIAAHLSALEQENPDLVGLYKRLGEATLPIVAARGTPIDELRKRLNA